ncbi:MAG TPA: hypothetical protein VK999_08625 [Methylotenera sp.]|nr:hypothetical protein [Methylotenera sp.]
MDKGLLVLIFWILLLVSGCASTGRYVNVDGPKIDRISPEDLARLIPPPVAKLTLDDLVRLTKEGSSAEQIIGQIKATDSMYDLTPSQSVDLSQKGVDAKVLDYIHTSREAAIRNQLADEINRSERQKQAEVAKLKNRMWQQQRYYDPFCRGYYGIRPYGFGGYGRHFGSHFGFGLGIGRPLGCW